MSAFKDTFLFTLKRWLDFLLAVKITSYCSYMDVITNCYLFLGVPAAPNVINVLNLLVC